MNTPVPKPPPCSHGIEATYVVKMSCEFWRHDCQKCEDEMEAVLEARYIRKPQSKE